MIPLDVSIAVYACTRYQSTSEPRFKSGINYMKRARERGIACFVSDTSSDLEVKTQLHDNAYVIDLWGTTMQAQKATALGHAITRSKAKVIIHSEIEKEGLVDFLPSICQPICDGNAVLVIPTRTAVSWASYPTAMAESETFAVRKVQQFTGHGWDIPFGPFAFDREVVHYFLCGETARWKNWECLHRPRLQILHDMPGRTAEVAVDFIYPPAMREQEENDLEFASKRLDQLPYMLRPLIDIFGARR